VNNRHWLNVAEYGLLVGSGVGSLAAVASQQIVYTAAPLSALMLVNVANRRRLEALAQNSTKQTLAQLDYRISEELSSLQKHVQVLPNFLDLASLRKALQSRNQDSLQQLSREVERLNKEINRPEWASLQKDVKRLRDGYLQITDSMSGVLAQASRGNVSKQVESLEGDLAQLKLDLGQLRVNSVRGGTDEQMVVQARGLQDQINHINRRISNLPTPMDANALRQDVDALLKIIAEQASRRDLTQLGQQVDQMQRQQTQIKMLLAPMRATTAELRTELAAIADQFTQAQSLQAEFAQPQEHRLQANQPQAAIALQPQTNEVQFLNAQPSDAQPLAVQTAEVQVAEVQTAEVQTAEVQIAEIQIAEVQTAEVQTLATQPLDAQPLEVEPLEVKPSEAEANPPLAGQANPRMMPAAEASLSLAARIEASLEVSLDPEATTLPGTFLEGLTPADQASLLEPLNALEETPDASMARSTWPVINQLQEEFRVLDLRLEGLESVHSPQALIQQVEQCQAQLAALQKVVRHLDHEQIELRDWVQELPEVLNSAALHRQLNYLAARIDWMEQGGYLQNMVNTAVQPKVEEALQDLKLQQPEYELVFDLPLAVSLEGQAASILAQQALPAGLSPKLEGLLEATQSQFVVVYPYPRPDWLGPAMIRRFHQFLQRGGQLSLGWGHLGDQAESTPREMQRRRAINPVDRGFLYEVLNQLTDLKQRYPDQFRFKVLGTNEQFWVSDRSVAILGTQTLPTASALFPQAALGIKTTNRSVIEQLVTRFEDPQLEATDTEAYFKRALTRYDLGDRAGALADYSEVLRVQPHNALTLNNRALARYDLGDKRGAMEDFNTALDLNPHAAWVIYCNRGYIRSELGDRLGAIEDFTYAIQLNSDYAAALFCRGLSRTRMRNTHGAIEDYSEVIRLEPENGMAYFYRGIAWMKLGHSTEAAQDLRRAAQLFSQQQNRKQYRQVIKAIRKLHRKYLEQNPTTDMGELGSGDLGEGGDFPPSQGDRFRQVYTRN
jgi:tetratricopeptide (TPR) repeat protein